ncbi:MAG: sodium-translocating pyrophosphatase [Clostridia bacterium]|nr:sodium-translocating pyrophosphatase [Clostridia bacterium]
MENLLIIIAGVAIILAIAYAVFNYFCVKKLEEGTEKMGDIAGAIRIGANAFIKYEYKLVAIIGSVIAVVVLVVISWQAAIAFVIGAVMSASAGWVGMKIATYSNVRVTNTARQSKDLGKTLKVAFKGGSVMGLCVAGFALLGIVFVYCIFGLANGQIADIANGVHQKNFIGLETSFTMTLSGYALGCSIIAMFNRVGGGIYTKAADMGADLVGKTEAHIPEDDPRNPATIADNVGDNVGDVAGLGSDLLESYVGAILSAIILAGELFMHSMIPDTALLQSMLLFPLVFAGCGLLACIIGISYIVLKPRLSKNVHMELNIATWIAAGLTVAAGCVVSYFMFRNASPEHLTANGIGFKAGAFSPWLAAVCGIAAGIVIGVISEYYTSYDYKPTKKISKASKEGPALTVTQGLANGMISCMLPVVVLVVAIYGSYALAGMYGIACAAFGMLSFVAATVSVDTYGPISDNAGGIAEMSELDPEVREITDKLDSVGNTTAAIGKGFAIGSAAFAALSLMTSYLFAFSDINLIENLILNMMNPLVLCGALCGAALPFFFSGLLIEAVAKAARKMVEEVRRQFREIPGILEGTEKPDYKTCISISSQGALKEMRVPCIFCILFPLVTGFIFGPYFVGGVLIGATVTAIMLALFCGNAGGAWDNAKKYIEAGGLNEKDENGNEVENVGKGSPAHDAAVVGDTVGDPLKDTVGPSLDILIKIMSTISLVAVVVFSQWNVFGALGIG